MQETILARIILTLLKNTFYRYYDIDRWKFQSPFNAKPLTRRVDSHGMILTSMLLTQIVQLVSSFVPSLMIKNLFTFANQAYSHA